MPAIRIEIRGQSFDAPLPETPVRIGKSDGADLCIQGEGIGGEHCVLEPLGGGRTKLKDLGSGYETLVNGVVAKQISLGDGDVIQVGEARITYLAHAAGAPAPAPAAEAIPAATPPPPPPPPPARPKAAKPKAAKPAVAKPAVAKPKAAAPQATKPDAPEAPAPRPATADAATPDARERGARAKKKSGVPVVGILAGVVVLVGLFFFLNAMGGKDAPSYAAEVKRGRAAFDDQDYAAARAAYERVIQKAPEGADKIAAQEGLQLVASVEREMDAKLERLRGEGLVLTPDLLRAERQRFLTSYGEGQAARFDAAQAAMLRAQERWKQDNVAATRAVADRHLEGARFVAARDAWDTLGGKAPAAIDVTAEVREAFAALESAATAKADELIESARDWNEAGLAYRSVKLLGDMLPHFEGFPAHARLEKALATAKAESAKTPAIPDRPTRPTPTRPGPSTQPDRPTPTDPTRPPTDTAREEALREQADAVVAAASEHVDARRFREAAAQIMNGARQLTPGSQRTRIEGVADDFGLAARAKDALIAHIKANADRYANVRLAPRVRATIIEADGEYLHARVTGGTSKHAWARLPGNAWVGLLGRMKPGADEAVPAAALLHVIAREEDAERMLASAVEQGHAAEPVFERLARWRGIEVPEGGFVLHEGRYVTPAERDHLVREAQIADALAKLDSRKPEERAEAAQALLAIGEPARERFADALSRRRAFLLDEIVRSKSYRSGKHKAKLLKLLDERRKHALALIYDAQAYPYPNPQKKNQAEVEARVDQVREIWERPFDLVSQWDKSLRERIEGLTEVDTLLDQVQSGFDPNLDELKKRINEAIDVPSSADGGNREYSLKVMVYNTTLDTTAGEQEKANVRSVNRYRMMMGLLAVKIDERLVRAARGHSRHMATNGYFAHNVPDTYATPVNRTPGSRAKQQGFGGGVGENIARGPGTGHGAFMAWFRSSGHHRNMLGKGWLVMGCGRANQTWWTQLFGGGSKSLDAPDPLPAPEAPFAPDEIDRPKARDE